MSNSSHAFHQTDLSKDLQVLNISVNLARISKWINSLDQILKDKGVSVYKSRVDLINKLFIQTQSYLKDLQAQDISKRFSKTLIRLREDFDNLGEQTNLKDNQLYWAEKTLTWADILQHRAKLA